MSSIEAMKEEARRHEQREQWRDALALYQKAIKQLEVAEQPDIGLYNRVGDIRTRVGDIEAAVESYERAVDLYVESDLPNNAIAVCKKIIRNMPLRNGVYLRMGQIRAEQGFLVDARQNFLTYAERMQATGQLDEAFRALSEFADLAPGDYEIRLAVAEQMRHHDRADEALEQLSLGYRAALAADDGEEPAALFEQKLNELDPTVDLDAIAAQGPPPGARSTARDDELAFESTSLSGGEEIGGGEAPHLPEAEDAEEAGEVEGATGTATDTVESGPPGAGRPGADDTDEEEGAGGVGTEEDIGLDEEPMDLPFLDTSPPSPAPAPAPSADVPPTAPPTDPADIEDADETVSDDLDGRIEATKARIRSEPDDLSHRQRLVELAFRKSDDAALASAYLGLAEALARDGQDGRARAVFQQVLSVDPGSERARAALAEGTGGGAAAAPVQEVASSEEYVDLGSMILDEEEEEKSTRFVVAYEEPSGDEQADFARMLSQFKAKVSENFAADDVKAHHDLGTAYKEMGLLDEAIEEFQHALRAAAGHLPTYELLGQCFIEKGHHDMAVRSLERALETPHEVEDELIGIYYYLGRAHEELGNKDSAKEFYDQVFSLDINFADVTERLRELR